ncbi:MAG: TRAP transporter substrate-binding protein, partial [Bradyrhizobium sp.]
TFQNPPFHPKWKEVSLSAPLPDWQRLPVADQWLKTHNVEAVARGRFDEFLKQSPASAATVKSDSDREALFRQFQAWEAERSARAQTPNAPTQR